MDLLGRRILVGACGGIAAYKVPHVVRELQSMGAEVRCVATRAALRLTSADTLAALTRQPVLSELFGGRHEPTWTRHIDTAIWAEAFLVAPLTADTAARLASGRADDALAMAWMTVQGPRLIAPSMNSRMLCSPALMRNLRMLQDDGALLVPPEEGFLACGEEGPGRMPEPRTLAQAVAAALRPPSRRGRLLLTTGRTEEPVDDVRVLTNRSSGRTGAAVAALALARGWDVVAVVGPSEVSLPAAVRVVPVCTALQMEAAVEAERKAAQAVVCAAAVADARPMRRVQGKIEGSRDLASIDLVPNPDILAGVCERRIPGQIVAGFALEVGDLHRGSTKLARKGADIAVCNDPLVEGPDAGFGRERVWGWVGRAGEDPVGGWLSKEDLAARLMDAIESLTPSEQT